MDYLKEDEVYEGAIVPIYLSNAEIEGYATLVESAGETLSFMNKVDKNQDGAIYIRQRWLIEWADPDILTADLPESFLSNKRFRKFLWDQRSLSGKKAHRFIEYYVAENWDEYAQRYGRIKQRNYNQRGNSMSLDDSSILF